MARRYRQRRRAEQQKETRQRIVQATMELHEEIGPAETTIRAIAERAGVQRLTVYRHFPDERSLFGACSALHLQQHPLPSFASWAEIPDPVGRMRNALTEMYTYYGRSEPMIEKILRDVSRVPSVAEMFESVSRELERGREILVSGWVVGDNRRNMLSAVIGHALAFQTWQSLVRSQHLSPVDAVELMVRLAQMTAEPEPGDRHETP